MSPASEVVGRESEIDSVHDFLEAVPGGPVALLIEGEAGIGKTTLWREGIADAGERGLQVLTSRPVEAEIALPFAVLGDLLGDVPDAALGRLPDPQREALEVALLRRRAGTRPGGLQRRAVALGVLGALRVLAEDTALVVAIDDTQWLDPPSGDALAFAARRLRDEPIGFLLARRAEAGDEDSRRARDRAGRPPPDTARDRPARHQVTRSSPAGPARQAVPPPRAHRAAAGVGRQSVLRARARQGAAGARCLPRAGGAAAGARDAQRAGPGAARRNPCRGERRRRSSSRRSRGRPSSSWPPAVGVGRPRSRRRQPPESWRSPTAASGSHTRCSPRSSTRRHRRLGDASCTPGWRRSSTIRTSRRSISPSLRAVRMPRWPRPSRMPPDVHEHAALRTPQRSSGSGRECSRRPMTPTLGGGRSKPGTATSRRGTPTGRGVFSRMWWRACLRVASAPSRSRASRGSPGSGVASTSPSICSAMRSQRSATIPRRASRSNGDSHGASTRPVTSRRPSPMRVRRSSSPSVSGSPACSRAHWRKWPSSRPFAGEEFRLRSSSAPSSSRTRQTSGGRSSDASEPAGSTGCCSSGRAISMLLVRRSPRFATPCSRAATSTP